MARARKPPGSGPDIHATRAVVYGAAVGVCTVPAFAMGAERLGLSGFPFMLFMLGGGLVTGAGVAGFIGLGLHNAAKAASTIYAPTGGTTPYERVFSYQHALEMRGDFAGARESFEALIAESPGDAAVRFAAAAFCAGRGKDPARAAELYREIRLLPGATIQHEAAATNGLIDLYRGPLADDARARAELRRYAERFAGSPEGEMARRTLEEMRRAPADGTP